MTKKQMIAEVKRIYRSVGHEDDYGIRVVYLTTMLKELREPGYWARQEKLRLKRLKAAVKKMKLKHGQN